ncbi:MAG: type IX secretion system membrane protein PorP/SprF [Cryomorphaceae bacterium]|nr:type IX secretion system membrane protein PorP/SprF [Cryomorphaceae bacterium]
MKYLQIILSFVLLLTFKANAQQEANFSFQLFNPLTINSGYAGVNEGLNCMMVERAQWVSVPGHPRTSAVTVDSPLRGHNLAIAATFTTDQIGPARSTSFSADFAYRLYLTKKTRLALGIKGSITSQSLRFSELQNIDQADFNFSQDIQFKAQPNIGFGAYLWNERYFVGLSSPRLMKQKSADIENIGLGSTQQHMYVCGGVYIELNEKLKLKPTVLIRHTQGAPIAIDINTSLLINELLWVGASYRFKQAWGTNVKLVINEKFRLGYAYEQSHTNIQVYTGGTHEVLLGFLLKYKDRGSFNRIYF